MSQAEADAAGNQQPSDTFRVGLAGGSQENTMNKLFPTALGLKVAIGNLSVEQIP